MASRRFSGGYDPYGFFGGYDPYDGYKTYYTAAPYQTYYTTSPYEAYYQQQPAPTRSSAPTKPAPRPARETKTIPVHGPDSEPERETKAAVPAGSRADPVAQVMSAEEAAVRMQAAARRGRRHRRHGGRWPAARTTPMSDARPPVIPGAEPFSVPGGPHGALVVHGFTGNPSSLRPVAEALAAAGFAVELPLLPGHGTSVEDMAATRFSDWAGAVEACYLELAGRTDAVVVAGLSMGGTLAAWLATRQPRIAGVVAVNGLFDPPAEAFADMLRTCLEQGQDRLPGIGSDIAAPGVAEMAYEAAPIEGLLSLHEAVGELHGRLAEIRCPVLVLTSPQDHIVPPVSSDVLAARVSGPVERVVLERSYHVATLDHDRDLVVERTVEFALRVTSR
jgi:carboxylesterase